MSAGGLADPGLTRKGRATRERIVRAAAALMFERGATGTSLDEVQAAAGVSSSQIYHYFQDKKVLIRAVISRQTDEVLGAQEPLLSELDSVESLRRWRDQIVGIQRERQCEGGCPIGSLAGQLAEVDPLARKDLADGFERWESAIRSGLLAMRDRGDLRADADAERLGTALLVALQGGLLLTQVHRNTTALEAGLDTVIEHIASLASDTARRLR
ncbi:transcriptional regulator [Pseudonocardia sulfidoxydans NBRC 16205]|uniref:Transcriptional regulator n=1 Tax=Pseudonocardia sulfidoxydans NBRC 16205 TaxID=1223511 RepID=A0A511DNF9_9PSEU|nr:TetR/AcrR family transcriptional regulator [Pseudonocardia sulfidoxydans]GEL26351.1 transcriptional regulator [Pseudonocardia sulfidoxydans NBRC 16205]